MTEREALRFVDASRKELAKAMVENYKYVTVSPNILVARDSNEIQAKSRSACITKKENGLLTVNIKDEHGTRISVDITGKFSVDKAISLMR